MAAEFRNTDTREVWQAWKLDNETVLICRFMPTDVQPFVQPIETMQLYYEPLNAEARRLIGGKDGG